MIGRPFRVNWHPEDTPETVRAASSAGHNASYATAHTVATAFGVTPR